MNDAKTETTKPETTKANGASYRVRGFKLPSDWHTWPTAAQVARKLHTTRQHVYRLETKGTLTGVDGYSGNRLVRRFDPESVEPLVPPNVEQAPGGWSGPVDEDDDDEDDDTPEVTGRPKRDRAAQEVALLAEARRTAQEARRALHEAYQLLARPLLEFQQQTLTALRHSHHRNQQLEERLNVMHDQARDERKEDREFVMLEREQAVKEQRTEVLWATLREKGPELLGQVLASFGGKAGGPIVEKLSRLSEPEQAALVRALDAIISVEREAVNDAAPAAEKAEKHE